MRNIMARRSHQPSLLLFVLACSVNPLEASKPDSKRFDDPITVAELSQSPYYTKVSDSYSTALAEFPEQFIIKLPNAQLISNSGLVITEHRRPVFDYVHEEQSNFPDWKVEMLKRTLALSVPHEPEQFNGTIALLAIPGEHFYYQWMLEVLPRLKTLQMSGIPFDKIFVGYSNKALKKETLERFGLTDKQVIYGKHQGVIKAQNVIIPSMPHMCPATRPTWACDLIRATFLDETIQQRSLKRRKLYIAQKAALTKITRNVILNESDLETHLAHKGFESVYLENLSVKDQALLFNSAEIIVAAHGNLLTNLIFCNSELPVSVIEMYPPGKANRCYTSLTDQLNEERNFQFNHICLRTSSDGLSDEDKKAQNLSVDCDQLDKALATYKKWFSNYISLEELSQTPYYTKVIDAYQAPFTPDSVIQRSLTTKDLSDNRTTEFPEQFIINLPNAQLLSNAGMVITEDSRPFFDYVHQIGGNADWKIHRITQAFDEITDENSTITQPELFDGSLVVLTAPGSHAYYHWMLELLPRLKLLQMSGVPYDKVFAGEIEDQYKKETLDLLGLTHDKIVQGNEKTFIQAKNLIIPSIPNNVALKRPTWACDFIRSLFIDDTVTHPAQAGKKLYISRKTVTNQKSRRMIINEDEFKDYLIQKGFEIVVLEDFSVKEQAQLFNAAEIIIAAHGASLTNVIFCDPQRPVTVIEIFQPGHINECYTSLTQQLNNDRGFKFTHTCYCSSTENLSENDKKVNNIYISLNEIKELLT